MYQPFSDDTVMWWDILRVYSVLAGITVQVGGLIQLFHPLPGIRKQSQVARGLHIVGVQFILLGLAAGNIVRLGVPPAVPSFLIFSTIGVTILLAWLVCERRARWAST